MIEVELHQLELRYADLRLGTAGRQARLTASLMEHGQQTPVLVVSEGERYVLIDGYARVEALRCLGRDLVNATLLELSEAEALVLSYRLERGRRRSVLEEAWLIAELVERHGKSQRELALQLGRSPSWISRHLALARHVPEEVEMAVRRGTVCAHAAMKYLVPLARANTDACRQLLTAIGGEHLSERQLGKLYNAWRAADASNRERLVSQPLLYLAAEQETARPDEPSPGEAHDQAMVRDLRAVCGICDRLRRGLVERSRLQPTPPWPSLLRLSWSQARGAFVVLNETVDNTQSKETSNAR